MLPKPTRKTPWKRRPISSATACRPISNTPATSSVPACRVALAIQRAENPRGACEIYHYNTDGTLDWGYFQINTVHLTSVGFESARSPGLPANIDFAYQLYQERGFQPWSTYNNGAYRRFLRSP